MINRRLTYLFIKEENRDSHKLHVFLEVQGIPEARKPEAMLWLLRPRRRDSKVEWRTPGRRFDELERQRETFSRRWLKLRGINEFCGDADWVHQRWESYIYGLQRGYKSGTFMIKRFKMGTWRVHRWKNRLRTYTRRNSVTQTCLRQWWKEPILNYNSLQYTKTIIVANLSFFSYNVMNLI